MPASFLSVPNLAEFSIKMLDLAKGEQEGRRGIEN